MNKKKEIFFKKDEFEKRIFKVRVAMEKTGADLLLTTHPSHVFYLTGHFTQAINDPMCLILPINSQPILDLPYFELPRNFASSSGIEKIDNWEIDEDPVNHIVSIIKDRKLNQDKTIIDVSGGYTPYLFLKQLLHSTNATPVTNIVDNVRLIKSSEEQKHLRVAAEITDIGTKAALDAFSEDVLDYDVAAACHYEMIKAGCDILTCDPYICIGWRTGSPHSNRGGEVAKYNDPLFIELGATRARYTTPLMRSAVIGNANKELIELAKVSNEIIETVCDVACAGISAAEVASKGKAVINHLLPKILWHNNYGYSVGAGFAPAWIDCPHFLINEKNTNTLLPGMVFHLPTQIRINGVYGAGFSETIIITESGCEQLSKLPRELIIK